MLVRAAADATVGDLVEALHEAIGGAALTRLSSERLGWLASDAELASGVLRDGEVVRDHASIPQAVRRAVSGLELHVTGGPGAGRRIPLPLGDLTIGRGDEADVVVDDPSLSRAHFVLRTGPSAVTVTDAGSRNGTWLGAVRLAEGEWRPVDRQARLRAGRSSFVVRSTPSAAEDLDGPSTAVISFNRSPRVRPPVVGAHLHIGAPPSPPRATRLPVAASAAPLALGVVMAAVLHEPAMLAMSALSPVMALSSYFGDRRSGGRAHRAQVARHRADVDELEVEVERTLAEEGARRRQVHPDAPTLVDRAMRRRPDLWERGPQDDDFLVLRVGEADQPSGLEVVIAPGGDAGQRTDVDALVRRARTLPAAPVVVPLGELGTIGIAGGGPRRQRLATWLALQLAVLHSPRHLALCAVVPDASAADWRWLGWLPHVAASPVDVPALAVGDARTEALLEALRELVRRRRAERGDRFGGRTREQAVVLLLDEDVGPRRQLIEELLQDGPEVGVFLVWLGGRRRDLPAGCGAVLELDARRAVMQVSFPVDGRTVPDATCDGVDGTAADQVARVLAPMRDVTGGGRGTSIPRSVGMLELLGGALDDLPRRYELPPEDALACVVGQDAEGPVRIDLRQDGPHALVAGTTGAGKSELLQALVAGLAVERPPTRVSFLFVDYKGGTAFKECVDLPHCVGMVTDLDEHLTQRVLTSLRAEVRARERTLNAHGARDLPELERTAPDAAPAALIVVVDEFAALKVDVPEFVDGLVDVAQRGRSLGVHLVLATQRPAGVVSENIRTNTNLRIALRVQTEAESVDVVNDRRAALLPTEPRGRAFVRTGHGRVREVQVAFGGAVSRGGVTSRPVEVVVLAAEGPADEPAAPALEGPTDLSRVVHAIGQAAAGGRRPPSPWLPPLPSVLHLDDLEQRGAHPTLGLADEPAQQMQRPWELEVAAAGSVLIYGASGTGKTTALRSIAVALARLSSPERLHLHAIDCAGHGLTGLEALPQCSGVLGADDEERVGRLLRTLLAEVERRGRLLASHGAGSLDDLDESIRPPRTVVLLDSLPGFREAYDSDPSATLLRTLGRVMGEGRAAGVHVVATCDRRGGVPSAITSVVSRRIVLRMPSDDDYAVLGLDRRATAGTAMPPGRAFVDDGLEVQLATLGAGTSGAGALTSEAASLRRRWGGLQAPPVLTLPTKVGLEALGRSSELDAVRVGIRDDDLRVAVLDLASTHALVVGPRRSGRTTTLGTLAAAVAGMGLDSPRHLLLGRRSAPEHVTRCFDHVVLGERACAEAVSELLAAAAEAGRSTPRVPVLVAVDDVEGLVDGPAAAGLERLLRDGLDLGVCLVATTDPAASVAFNPVMRELRKAGCGVLLQPGVDADGSTLNVRLPRRRGGGDLPAGRGYLVQSGRAQLVQLATDEPG